MGAGVDDGDDEGAGAGVDDGDDEGDGVGVGVEEEGESAIAPGVPAVEFCCFQVASGTPAITGGRG